MVLWVWAVLVATPVAAQTTTTATISANVGTLAESHALVGQRLVS